MVNIASLRQVVFGFYMTAKGLGPSGQLGCPAVDPSERPLIWKYVVLKGTSSQRHCPTTSYFGWSKGGEYRRLLDKVPLRTGIFWLCLQFTGLPFPNTAPTSSVSKVVGVGGQGV